MNLPATQRTVVDLIDEYEEKNAQIEHEVAEFQNAFTRLEMAACIQGKFAGNVTRHRPFVYPEELRKNLLKSGWQAIYDRLQIDMIAPAKDKKLFERTLADPPALTFETAKATFGDYLLRPRFHILRGLAETFVDLDPAYKSHSKVKVGVSGLPKRVIISNVGGYGSYGRDKLRDMINALATYRGIMVLDNAELIHLDKLNGIWGHVAGDVTLDGSHVEVTEDKPPYPNRGITIRKFQNGNAHVIFDKDALLDINRALAEFYGDVLPDAEEEDAKPQASTAVSKDLQFYATPQPVIDEILSAIGVYRPKDYSRGETPCYRILEPSCGDGRILDEIKARGSRGFGIEVHAPRAAEAKAKGHAVVTGNFLDQPSSAEFDFVVMNPPFYGRHYVKHVMHALKFLKPGGSLVSVLPATAWYDHKELDGRWQDLPVASFAESGTNIPTGYLRIQKRAA
jgi:hypothetical protein